VFSVAPFAQQDGAWRKLELAWSGAELDLGMLCADGFKPLLDLGRQPAKDLLLQLVGNAGLDMGAVRVVRPAGEVPILYGPEFCHRQAGQFGDPRSYGRLLLVHHNFSC